MRTRALGRQPSARRSKHGLTRRGNMLISSSLGGVFRLKRLLSISSLSLLVLSCSTKFDNREIVVEAYFMQYACGPWNDDLKVLTVNDTSYRDMVDRDIDPEFVDGTEELRDLFLEHGSPETGMTFRLTGRVSEKSNAGCDDASRKFLASKIEKPHGQVLLSGEELY